MELRHLGYFAAAVEEGSLTTAAECRLRTSQPSLSRQIRELEDQVGAELLSRSVQGGEWTAAGKVFLDHARLPLMQVEAAVLQMPAYVKNLLPSSMVSRPMEGEAPTIDVAADYGKSNTSPILKLFLSRLDELVGPNQKD